MSANDRQFPEAEAYRPILRLLWFYLKCLQRLPWNRPEVNSGAESPFTGPRMITS